MGSSNTASKESAPSIFLTAIRPLRLPARPLQHSYRPLHSFHYVRRVPPSRNTHTTTLRRSAKDTARFLHVELTVRGVCSSCRRVLPDRPPVGGAKNA